MMDHVVSRISSVIERSDQCLLYEIQWEKGFICIIILAIFLRRDINECAFNNGGCEHTCRDTDGSVECTCKSGYRRSANRRSCEDDNECSRNPCLGRTCINTIGGFQCVELKLLNDGTSNLRFDGSIVSSTNEEPVPEPFIDIDEADGKVSTNVGTVVWLSLLTVLVITMVAASLYVYRKSQRNGSDQMELQETSSEEHVENGSSD